jgi:branched-chain amino acid transport system permease protein
MEILIGILSAIFIEPFLEMAAYPDLFFQGIWDGFVSGMLYGLIALGFVLIFKASGVFNFSQPILVVLAALALVSFYKMGVPAWISVLLVLVMFYVLAWLIERLVLRQLVNQDGNILFMSTIGLTFIIIGTAQWIFGGVPSAMITEELGLPNGSVEWSMFGGGVYFEFIDIAAAVIATIMIIILAVFFSKTKIGRGLRAVADDHQAALSVGISLNQIWVIVWFVAGIVALVTGIFWGARSDVSFALQIIGFKALPVLIIGGFTSVPGAIIGGLIIGLGEKVFEIYWGPLLGSGVEGWFAYVIALLFLLYRPQGLFGDKIIERV